ncbi:LysM peptidoglycan-binding domain-containing protein [Nocardioides sp. L-11A]|uniref:LysM peptidoglycan-binding domain-containing protein n=1 Tax=Nocardioides sp. L-11A TaxID=3043848 RepID=UPI00249A8EC4|nr:LysM peptidoglycan-binding domain-containing protein [Nocardioides sp. L-11A]
MNLVAAGRVRMRAALLWLTTTAALGGLGALAAPAVRRLATTPGPSFADLLVQACAAVALVAGVALWVLATDVASGVLRSGGVPPGRAVGPVRRLLLAAYGVAVLAGTAPASAEVPTGPDAPTGAAVLDGLPLPDRPLDRPARDGGPDPAVVVVRPGDSLWSIAAHHLGPGASPSDLASYWQRVQALNAAALGPDPDLIHPGQSLRLPPT